jgi:hypothetical protein
MKTQFCCPSISKYSLSPTLKRAACRRHFATDVYFSFRENICFKSSTYISNSITRVKKWTSGWQHEGTEVLVICQGCNAFIMELLMDSWSLCPGWLRASPRSPLRAWGTRSSRRPPIAPSTDPRGTVLQGTTPHLLYSGWQWPTLPYFLWGPQGPLGVPCTVWSCRRGSATEGLDGGGLISHCRAWYRCSHPQISPGDFCLTPILFFWACWENWSPFLKGVKSHSTPAHSHIWKDDGILVRCPMGYSPKCQLLRIYTIFC